MPNIASVLKAEISRVARKEVRTQMEVLKKANVQQRTAMAALRGQVDALQKELRRVGKNATGPSVSAGRAAADGETVLRRFSPGRLAAHRKKTGLSAADYGKLVGIGGQTIYNWEVGKSRPSPLQIQQLALVKGLSRLALQDRLGAEAPS